MTIWVSRFMSDICRWSSWMEVSSHKINYVSYGFDKKSKTPLVRLGASPQVQMNYLNRGGPDMPWWASCLLVVSDLWHVHGKFWQRYLSSSSACPPALEVLCMEGRLSDTPSSIDPGRRKRRESDSWRLNYMMKLYENVLHSEILNPPGIQHVL